MRISSALAVVLLGCTLAGGVVGTESLQDCSSTIAGFRNASVSIRVEGTVKTSGEIKESAGTGVIVSPQGYVLTNHHVIDLGPNVDGLTYNASIGSARGQRFAMQYIDSEPTHDLALLKFENTSVTYGAVPALPDVSFQTGVPVCSFGYPLDVEFHVTAGTLGSGSGPGGWWILNLATNPGESGSPVFGADGKLLGLRVAGRADAVSIYYMVPLSFASRLLALVPRFDAPTLHEQPAALAKRYWEALHARDNERLYAMAHPNVRRIITAADSSATLTREVSQFVNAPVARDEETSMEQSGVYSVTTISRFADGTRFREYLYFAKDGDRWSPTRSEIYPVDWPIGGNGYQFLPLPPAALVQGVAATPEADRARFIAQAYEGKFTPPPGLRLQVEGVGNKFSAETCDVFSREEGTGTPIMLHRLFGGCSLTRGVRLQAFGRVKTIDTSLHLESVRMWRD